MLQPQHRCALIQLPTRSNLRHDPMVLNDPIWSSWSHPSFRLFPIYTCSSIQVLPLRQAHPPFGWLNSKGPTIQSQYVSVCVSILIYTNIVQCIHMYPMCIWSIHEYTVYICILIKSMSDPAQSLMPWKLAWHQQHPTSMPARCQGMPLSNFTAKPAHWITLDHIGTLQTPNLDLADLASIVYALVIPRSSRRFHSVPVRDRISVKHVSTAQSFAATTLPVPRFPLPTLHTTNQYCTELQTHQRWQF